MLEIQGIEDYKEPAKPWNDQCLHRSMADPLSLSASIIAVIQLTGTVLGYLHSVKSSTKDHETVLREATSILGLLNGLQFQLEDCSPKSDWFISLRNLAVQDGPLDQYKAALELLQERISPSKEMRKTRVALEWHFSKVEVERILQRIERLKSRTQIALEMDHFKLSQAIQRQLSDIQHGTAAIKEDTFAIRRSNSTLLEDNRELRTAAENIKGDTKRLIDESTSQQVKKIADWISIDDFTTQQSDIIERRQSNTGGWFLGSKKFREWQMGKPSTLYCPGHPGTGKTMMASIAIDHLQRTLSRKETPILFIYCNYKRQNEQSYIRLLRSMLRQVVFSCDSVPKLVKDLYEQHFEKQTQPVESDIIKSLQGVISTFPEVFLVIDALDECSTFDRSKLLSVAHSLQKADTVRLLVTSRHLPDVEYEVRPDQILSIRASAADVESFVRGRLPELSSVVRKSSDLQEEVVSTVVKAVDGMFLLARLHVDSLQDKRTVKAIKTALNRLPFGSDAYDRAYEEALQRISGQTRGDADLAILTISWVLKAKRPLKPAELQHALAIEPGSSALDEDNIVGIDEVLSLCAGLLTADFETNIVRLVHYTTQEYLDRNQATWMPTADSTLAMACVTVLLFDCMSIIGSREKNANKFYYTDSKRAELITAISPLLPYCSQYWGNHLRDVEKTSAGIEADLMSKTLSFIQNDNLRYICRSLVDKFDRARKDMYTCASHGIHVAAFYDLQQVMQHYISKEVDLEARDAKGRTPLMYAAERGSEGVLQLLLDSGKVNPNAQDEIGDTSLIGAANAGHAAVARILISSGAAVDKEEYTRRTALYYAATYGHLDLVKLLLDGSEAVIDSKDAYGDTPLSRAVYFGHLEIVMALVKTGKVDLNQ